MGYLIWVGSPSLSGSYLGGAKPFCCETARREKVPTKALKTPRYRNKLSSSGVCEFVRLHISAEGSVKEEQPLCRHCALLIHPGDARWTAREPIEYWHYACAEEACLVRSVPFVIPKVLKDTA